MGLTRLRNLRDRASIRSQLTILAGVLCIVTVAAVATTAAVLAKRQVVRETEDSLVSVARAMAYRLDQHMFERFREIGNIASLEPLRPIWRGDVGNIRGVLRQLQKTLPIYTWIGFATPNGTVKAATGGLLEGVSVSQRPWFQHGLKGATVEDVHDAKLLDKLLRTSADQAPFRFVDVAVPVYGPHDVLEGVLGAHLSWRWADEVRRSLLLEQRGSPDLELLVFGRDGKVLIGPETASLNPALVSKVQGSGGLPVFDGSGYVSGLVSTTGLGAYPGLGWIVMARRPVSSALAPADVLFFTILAAGLAAAVAGVVLAWRLCGSALRPMEALSDDIDLIGQNPDVTTVRRHGGSRDVLKLSDAVRSLLWRLGIAQRAEHEALEEVVRLETEVTQQARQNEDYRRDVDENLGRLKRLAETDALTGLLNRRGLMPLGEAAMAAAGPERRPAVLMIDVDLFKRINDSHGHACGDRVIQFVGQAIRQGLREGDHVARFGGEEFVALLDDAGPAEARALAERLRDHIARTPVTTEGGPIPVTVSIGLAFARTGDADFEAVVTRADEALYAAKAAGRDRVAVDGEDRHAASV